MGGSGKTLFAQYLALCISEGLPLFGQFGTTKGKVLHLDQEQGLNQTKLRYLRLANSLGIKHKLNIVRRSFIGKIDKSDVSLEDIEEELVKIFSDYGFVFIDSLKAISGCDENSSEIELVVKMLKRVADKARCCILLIHHKGKGSTDNRQSGRGHSSIYDSVDVQIDLDINKNREFILHCQKNRDGNIFDGIKFVLKDSGDFSETQNCKEKLELELIDAEVVSKEEGLQHRILECLGKLNEPTIQKKIRADIGGDFDKLKEALADMVSKTLIESIQGKGSAILYSLTQNGKNLLDGWK
jgi:hypothetical protein